MADKYTILHKCDNLKGGNADDIKKLPAGMD